MRERKLSDYYVNQEVWDIRYGKGRVIEVNEDASIICCYYDKGIRVDYQIDGKDHVHDVYPSLFFEEIQIPESANIPKKWTPKDGELYYTITKNRCLCVTFLRCNNSFNDENNINQDNCFRTEKEAQEKLDKILKVLKGE